MAAIISFTIYAYLGFKLRRNVVAWGFIGLGVLLSFALLFAPFLLFTNSPSASLVYWTYINMFGFILTIPIALYIAYRNKLIFNKGS